MTATMSLVAAATLAMGLGGQGATAQGLFSPVITVNDEAITRFELEQRLALLEFFNTPGATLQTARSALVDDRLRGQEMARSGLMMTDEGLRLAVGELAERANLTVEEFEANVVRGGIAIETLHDFVRVSASWREFIRQRYNARVTITEAEIDAELARTEDANARIEVLLSEIVIPAPPPDLAEAQATALRLSQITSIPAFAAEARSQSVVPSRERGGALDWVPVTNFPPQLQSIFLGLAPGQVTPPLQIPNGIVLLQLRSVRETGFRPATPAEIDYAMFYIPGGRTQETLAEAARIAARADSCTDLYEIAFDLPRERLDRVTAAPGQIPQEIAQELARLDRNEVSVALTTPGGDALILLMLCNRTFATPEGATREQVANAIRARKLSRHADILLAELRAAAVIVGE
ncbi:MAG: peptidylprolyl isomerase [Rubellimicrobium sp.]|nr:peptidylprolyl isomerase [Rubellimicrobium sp.]